MANPIFMCCSCKLIFLNETGYKCHLKSRPSHNQPVVDEIDNIDEHQDDELHGPNQLDPVSWQQRHTNNNNLNDQELPIEHPDFLVAEMILLHIYQNNSIYINIHLEYLLLGPMTLNNS